MYKQHPTDLVADGVRSPVNRVAARVVMRGESFQSQRKLNQKEQSTPFRLRVPASAAMATNPTFSDLTGRVIGSLTVLGLSEYNGKWSCRCVCGRYVLRCKKSVLNPANCVDACHGCRSLRQAQRTHIWRTTGADVPEKELPGVMIRFGKK